MQSPQKWNHPLLEDGLRLVLPIVPVDKRPHSAVLADLQRIRFLPGIAGLLHELASETPGPLGRVQGLS